MTEQINEETVLMEEEVILENTSHGYADDSGHDYAISFIDGVGGDETLLRSQIFSEIKNSLSSQTSHIDIDRDGKRSLDSVTVSLFPSSSADVLLMFDLADRKHFRQFASEGHPLVKDFRKIVVPGNWLRLRLLSDPSLQLSDADVVALGAPRIDYLRRRAAELPAKSADAPLTILFAPLHENWRDSEGAPMSMKRAMTPYVAGLKKNFDVIEATDGRNLLNKSPVTEDLLQADIVITDYTSLMYEAWALGKPVIFPHWLCADRIMKKAPKCTEAHIYSERIGHHADNIHDLRMLLAQGRQLGLGAGVAEFMADYLANWDGSSAGTKIAKFLETLADPEREFHEIKLREELEAAAKVKNWATVEALSTELIIWNPQDVSLHDRLAQAYNGLGKSWLELNSLENVVALKPNSADYHFRLALAAQRMGRHIRAADAYAEAIRLAPKKATADWHYKLGYMLETPGHDGEPDLRRASAAYEKACALDERAAKFGPGALHVAAGRWKPAIDAYTRHLAVKPLDAELRYRLGMAYDRCYEWAKAETCYISALALKPDNVGYHFRLGFVLERQSKFAEAAEAYLFAARRSKAHKAIWFYRAGYVLERLGRFEEACDAYVRVKEGYAPIAEPEVYTQQFGEEHIRLVRAQLEKSSGDVALWVSYSKLLEAAGDLPEAARAMREAVLRSPEPRADYASRLSALENDKRERSMLEARLARDCTKAKEWLRLSALLEKAGDLGGAVEAMRQVVLRSDDHKPEWYHRLGLLLFRHGHAQEACEAFRNQQILQKPHGIYEDKFESNANIRQISTYREFYDVLPIESKSVLYESYSGVSLSCNPYAIYRKIKDDPAFAGWKHFWVADSLDLVPEDMRADKNVFFCQRNGLLYMRLLASAEYLINNATFPSYFLRKDGQKYLNTWHGTPLKSLGADIIDPPLARANTARNFLQATHLIYPNEHTRHVMIDRNQISNMLTAAVGVTGYPRIDAMINATPEQKQDIRRRIGVTGDKPIVLYAPTFRGDVMNPDIEAAGVIDNLFALDAEGYDCIFRGHYFTEKMISKMDLPIKVAPASIDTCTLLSVVDVLVTDYSSIYFDFLPTKRPIIHIASDWDEYKRTRGTYFERDELPGKVCDSVAEAKVAIAEAVEKPAQFITDQFLAAVTQFCSLEDGKSADRVAKFLFSDSHEGVKAAPDAKNVLFYIGALDKNGITGSAMSLLRLLPQAGVKATVLVNNNAVMEEVERPERLKIIGQTSDTIIKTGAVLWSLEERWLNDKQNGGHYMSDAMKEVWVNGLDIEARRTVGTAPLDAVVDFDGYSPFMTNFLANMRADHHVLFMHNDIAAEWKARFPHLQRSFHSYPRYTSIATVSQEVCTRNLEAFGDIVPDAENRFTVIRNTIPHDEIERLAQDGLEDDPDFAKLKEDKAFRIINLARLSPEKNQRRLIDAIEILRDKGVNISAYILGRGPLMSELSRYRDMKGLNNVHLLGLKENPFPYLAAADALVLSSDYEGQPLVLMEAMVLGIPCVGTRIPGPDGMLDQGRGVLTDPDPVGLAAGIEVVYRGAFKPPKFDCAAYNQDAIGEFLISIGCQTDVSF